jgi:hypothetical protein
MSSPASSSWRLTGDELSHDVTADNNAASRYFTSICYVYSADGICVLAGGNSKYTYVFIFEVPQQMLLKRFHVSFNRSLDGVLHVDEVRFYRERMVCCWNARMMNFP